MANHLQTLFGTAAGNPAGLNAHFHEQAREFLTSLSDPEFLDRAQEVFALSDHLAAPLLQARLISLLPGLSPSGGDVVVASEVSQPVSPVAGPSTSLSVVSPQAPPAKRARRGAAALAAIEPSGMAPSSFPLTPANFSPLGNPNTSLPSAGRISRSASRGSSISASGSRKSERLSIQGSQSDLKRKRNTGGN